MVRLSDEKFLDICKAITKGHELSTDLYSEVILILYEKNKYDSLPEKELVRLFYGCANRTWNLPMSQFNKKYKRFAESVQIEKCASIYTNVESEETPVNNYNVLNIYEEDSEIQRKNRTFVESELRREPSDDYELFIMEITKMYFDGHGVTDIHKMTGVDRSSISKAIKQFEENVRNHYHRCCIS